MSWKSYAAVSGATVLAGWFASTSPTNAPAPTTPSQRAAPANVSAAADIEEQAARLQMRLRQEAVYQEPRRNPFRFGARQEARSAPQETAVAPPPPVETPPPIPQGPLLTLSGIAEDRVGERMERTAILSTPSGVLLVREGDEVLGFYRVAKIEPDAVELTRLSDGTALRLSLRISSIP